MRTQGTPRAPARACLSLLPSGPGEVRRVSATRGVGHRVYGWAVFSSAEDSPSGLGRTIGNRVGRDPSGVQIPYPPPIWWLATLELSACRRVLTPGRADSSIPAADLSALRRVPTRRRADNSGEAGDVGGDDEV